MCHSGLDPESSFHFVYLAPGFTGGHLLDLGKASWRVCISVVDACVRSVKKIRNAIDSILQVAKVNTGRRIL